VVVRRYGEKKKVRTSRGMEKQEEGKEEETDLPDKEGEGSQKKESKRGISSWQKGRQKKNELYLKRVCMKSGKGQGGKKKGARGTKRKGESGRKKKVKKR